MVKRLWNKVNLTLCLALAVVALFTGKAYAANVNETSGDNDSVNTAQSITLGDIVTGNLSNSNDEDYYKVVMPNDGMFQINFWHEYAASNNGWKVIIEKYTDSSYQTIGIYEIQLNSNSELEALPFVGAKKGEIFLIGVYSYGYTQNDYALYTSFTASNYYEKEVNNSPSTATAVTLGKSYKGCLNKSDDIDYYKIVMPADGVFRIDYEHEYYSSSNGWNIYLQNYSDYTYNNLGKFTCELNDSTVKPVVAYYAAKKGEVFYIYIKSYGYTSKPYTIHTSFTASNDYEKELNGDYSHATPIDTDGIYYGSVSTLTDYVDYDYYIIEPKAGENIDLYLTYDYYDSTYTYNVSVLRFTGVGYETVAEKSNMYLYNPGRKKVCLLANCEATPYYIRVSSSSSKTRCQTYTLELISDKAKITKQPVSTTVLAGNSASFALTATGNNLKYQWQYRLANTTDWKNWSGKTESKITVPYDAKKDGMGLRCVITDANGNKLTSNAVKLTYKVNFAITGNPANAKITKGTTASFKVIATGYGLKYQWQFMLAGKTTWTNWTGKTAATLSVPYDKKKNNMQVRCLVTDSNGNKLTSKTAVLVYTNLFEITAQPVSVTVESGHAAPFSVAVAGNGLTYQWQFKLASASGWKNWAGKTASLLKVPYDIKKNGMLVRCVITNDKGATITSGEAKLVYKGVAPAINRQPASISVVKGHAGVFSIGVSGDTLSFQWQYKLAGTTSWKNWSGKTESTLKVAYDANKNGMSVRCVVTDKNGKKVTSSAATMTYTK